MRAIICLIAIVSVSAAFAVTQASGKATSACHTNRTLQEATQAGVLPAIVAALHGGESDNTSLLACSTRKH